MLDEDRCWQALCERDAAFDGRFVFAVRSTGIFCRPSCPARRPARERVAFFADGEAARAAGFRPCRRCSPMGPSPSEQLDALVVAACRLLDEATAPMTLPQLAARIGLSPTHLARAFKARTGLTPHAWATARRRERLDAQLPEAGSVLDAALAVGYSGTRAPYAEARALTPAQRRRKGAGETLRYALAPIRENYDYILIDCPPSLNMLTINALVAADGVIIPMQCEYYALEGLSDLVNSIQRIAQLLNPKLQIEGLLRTMYDPRISLTNDVTAQLKEHFGDKLYDAVIPRNVRLAEAPSFGMPALVYDKQSRGAIAYLALAGELVRRQRAAAKTATA